jgi:hypothetical protein
MSSPTVSRRPPPVLAVPATVFTAAPPVVSVYLTTESALPHAADRVSLRWKTLRARLTSDGAPPGALQAVDALIDGSHSAGQTLMALAGSEGLLYTAHLPEPPEADSAQVGSLPHLAPLLTVAQTLLPHLVVVTDRLGAELISVLPDERDVCSAVDGENLHLTRSAPGGWSQHRFQQRAENRWETNAREVADAVTRLVDTTAPRVVVSGDVRAVQFLREHLPARVTELLTEVQGDYGALDEALLRSGQVVADLAAADTAALLADHRRELRPGGSACAGPEDTLAALNAGQVDTLLLDPAATIDSGAWFGPAQVQVAATAEALHAAGVPDPKSGPLADIAIRAAVATSAHVRIVPAATPELAPTGIAALLRYP